MITLEIKPVIYAITCLVNDMVYIGKATNYHSRLWLHIKHLKDGVHHCKKLQNDFDKFGGINFEFKILYELNNNEDVNLLELQYISSILPEKLYNTNLREERIVSYNIITGEIIERYFNFMEASKKNNIDITRIYLCCYQNNASKTVNGIGFCYESDIDKIPLLIIDKRTFNTGRPGNKIKAYKNSIFIKEFENQVVAAKELNLYQTNINACLKGRLKSTGGYTFKYA